MIDAYFRKKKNIPFPIQIYRSFFFNLDIDYFKTNRLNTLVFFFTAKIVR